MQAWTVASRQFTITPPQTQNDEIFQPTLSQSTLFRCYIINQSPERLLEKQKS